MNIQSARCSTIPAGNQKPDLFVNQRRNQTRSASLRAAATLLLVLTSLVTIAALRIPGADGGYLAKVTNSTNTAATNPYFTCTGAVTTTPGGAAYLAYPFGDSAGTAASDVSGNANTGLYTSTGITYNVANTVCPRDNKTAVTLDGSSGAISGPNTAVGNPTVFTLEIWFKTTTAQGKLIGFGSSRTGSSSNYDRHLYIDTNGDLEFGVYPSAVKTIATPNPVTDGNWHYAVATLSSAGMMLYLDGNLVASNTTVTTAQNFSGYWRIGYDNLSGWTNAPANYYFKGSLAWAAVYNYALTATQIAQHYAAGH